jgi:hypothetical protein
MTRNAILGSSTLAISSVYFWLASTVPVSQLSDAIGPRGLPRTYAVTLAALSLLLIAGSRRRAREPETAGAGGRLALSRAAGTLLIGIVYMLVLPWVGYLLSVAALILVTTYYQGGRVTRTSVLVALSGGVLFWVLFVALMGIPMPPGLFPPAL